MNFPTNIAWGGGAWLSVFAKAASLGVCGGSNAPWLGTFHEKRNGASPTKLEKSDECESLETLAALKRHPELPINGLISEQLPSLL